MVADGEVVCYDFVPRGRRLAVRREGVGWMGFRRKRMRAARDYVLARMLPTRLPKTQRALWKGVKLYMILRLLATVHAYSFGTPNPVPCQRNWWSRAY